MLLSNIYELFTEQDLHRASVQTGSWEFLIFCIGVVGGLCQFLSSVALAKSGEALTKRMRIISFASMLRQEMNWFDRQENNIGALVTQLSSDTGDLKVYCKKPNSISRCLFRIYLDFVLASSAMLLVPQYVPSRWC